ncbi:MAG: hypothetical protein DRP71_09720 [Verrucomicrobia bacterium]|nr:MAG: hypothetical protein DRP71_09720 [Verrucomicrobiota bacterium]
MKRKTTKKPTQVADSETVRKLTKTGNYTYYVTIPRSDITALGWREHQKVTVQRDGDSIVIRDWKAKRS